jgi:hypothetical protein
LEMDKIFKECGAVLVEKRVVNYAMCWYYEKRN